jgi:hypothetical protein
MVLGQQDNGPGAATRRGLHVGYNSFSIVASATVFGLARLRNLLEEEQLNERTHHDL